MVELIRAEFIHHGVKVVVHATTPAQACDTLLQTWESFCEFAQEDPNTIRRLAHEVRYTNEQGPIEWTQEPVVEVHTH